MEIYTVSGTPVLIDEEDSDLQQYKWYIMRGKDTCSAVAYLPTESGRKKTTGISRLIMERYLGRNLSSKERVDHIDRDDLNNQKSNLRICSHAENMRNRKTNKNNSSGYKGVYPDGDSWWAVIQIEGKTVSLGYYDTLEEAAHVRAEAEMEYYGEYGTPEFPWSGEELLEIRVGNPEYGRGKVPQKRPNTSGYKGICPGKGEGSWTAYIYVGGEQLWLGKFSSLEEAVQARAEAEVVYFGEKARPEFPWSEEELARIRLSDPNYGKRKSLQANNKSGVSGVAVLKSGKFLATITIDHKQQHLGTFSTIEEAVQARDEAKARLWDEWADAWVEGRV